MVSKFPLKSPIKSLPNSQFTRKLTLVGKINDSFYEKCHACLYWISQNDPKIECIDMPLFETDWNNFLKEIRQKYGGPFITHKMSPLVFLNENEYIGGMEKFLQFAYNEYKYIDKVNMVFYKKRCKNNLIKITIENPIRKYCYMDFVLSKNHNFTVIFELFLDIAPKTCKNFISLCNGFKNSHGKFISYYESYISRIVPGAFLQAGEILKGIFNIFTHIFI